MGAGEDAGIEESPCEGKAMFNPAALNPAAQAWRKVRRVVSCVAFIFIGQPHRSGSLACIKWPQLQAEGFDLIRTQVKLERVVHNLELRTIVLKKVNLTRGGDPGV